MLLMTRLQGERILVETSSGEKIWITAIYMEQGKMKIGIEADKSVKILREELVNKPVKPRAA